MFADNPLPDDLKITEGDLAATPPAVLDLVRILAAENATLRKRIEKLEAKLGEDSSNSNKPPSTDSPYDENGKPGEKKKKKSQNPRKKRKGFRQKFISPTETQDVNPSACSCGYGSFKDLEPYYTHRYIELPEIVMSVIHFTLYKGECTACGKTGKGYVPGEFKTGFGPRFTALVGEISGIDGNSRETVKTFCSSVLGVPVSLGAIQKIIDRASAAVKPHYETIRDIARSQNVNYLDETTWKKGVKLHWLRVMTNSKVACFMIHRHRSKKAFEQLIGTWEGIPVSDGYRLYQNWVNGRQTCLAHLIRRAQGLSERDDPELAKCGKWAAAELRRLCKMAKDPPARGE
jgi:transposase